MDPFSVLHPKSRRQSCVLKAWHNRGSVRLCDVARNVRLSPFHLERLIKAQTGLTFAHHLRRIRLRRAEQLLASGDYPIKEIAVAVGYTSTSTFDRAFKPTFRCSPKQWRSAALSEDASEASERVSGGAACPKRRAQALDCSVDNSASDTFKVNPQFEEDLKTRSR